LVEPNSGYYSTAVLAGFLFLLIPGMKLNNLLAFIMMLYYLAF